MLFHLFPHGYFKIYYFYQKFKDILVNITKKKKKLKQLFFNQTDQLLTNNFNTFIQTRNKFIYIFLCNKLFSTSWKFVSESYFLFPIEETNEVNIFFLSHQENCCFFPPRIGLPFVDPLQFSLSLFLISYLVFDTHIKV